MSKFGLLVAGSAVLAACGGCVVGNTVRTQTPARQAVVVDGQVYLVDVNTGQVSRIGAEAVANAEAFEPAGGKCGEKAGGPESAEGAGTAEGAGSAECGP